jgi:biopolymer transport protein ExbB
MKYRVLSLLLALLVVPASASAWWNDEWKSRKEITVDAGITGADIKENLKDFPVLVRLHAGNFGYFSELAENGKDLRFMADDKTPLKFQIEKFDAINEMALIWVRMPLVQAGANSDKFSLYYGNEDAPPPDGGQGVYDASVGLVYHFDDKNPLPQDGTANNNHAASSNAAPEPAGWIGAAARFNGAGAITVNPVPSLAINPANGWTFSAWLKSDQPQTEAPIFKAADTLSAVELLLRNGGLAARYTANGKTVETPLAPIQTPAQWHHVGLILRADKLELFLDGGNVNEIPVATIVMNPVITLGGNGAGSFLNGLLDEVQIATLARPVDWLKLSARSQSPDFTVVTMGEDESGDSGSESSFGVIIQNVTIDGWVVIGLTGIMFVIAMIVMVIKIIVLGRVRKDNLAFLAAYEKLSADADLASLDREESEEDEELAGNDFLSAIAGDHDHYQSSPLYHLYHTGIREMNKRVGATSQRALTPEAMRVIQAALDAITVRETQRLNNKMVLLSIAIAGGPYLGLLGTVVGVMITFAVIASTGDVNINAIAPGIAAALLATVAGLAVAIPSLFAYNYLTVQIKDVIADMRVFSDEFLAMMVEKAADRFRTD